MPNQFQQIQHLEHLQHLKILFISRAYPPIVGGIENQNWELGKWLGKISEITIVANKKGKMFLPFFLPYVVIYTLINLRKYDVLLLGDGVLSIVGWKAKFFYNKPVISVIHGLDLTYRSWLYQKFWVNIFIKKLDKLITVGNETARVAREKGISEDKTVFIPNGVDAEKFSGNYKWEDLEKIIGEKLENKKIILTSGRLAKRKGAAWFISKVMPKLPENIIYVVAGNGPDKENIKKAVQETGLSSRIKILGYVTDETRNILLNACDIFVQPNIKIPGDMEGFGISVLEAASSGIPVIASDLEGLKDAILDGRNGFLVESENAGDWVNKVNEILSDNNFRRDFGEKARQYVIDNFSWEKTAKIYLEEIEKIL